MPLSFSKNINSTCQLLIWKSTESIEELEKMIDLSKYNTQQYNEFQNQSRKKEWLISRVLVQFFLNKSVDIVHNEHGKPFLKDSEYEISISHSKNYLGIIIGKNAEFALDIEYLSDRVERVASRFLHDAELEFITLDNLRNLHLYKCWCAKEVLIKLYGKKNPDLRTQLRIAPFCAADTHFKGELIMPDKQKHYHFESIEFDGMLLVWSVADSAAN